MQNVFTGDSQFLISGKNKKYISLCCLLKSLSRVFDDHFGISILIPHKRFLFLFIYLQIFKEGDTFS